MLTRIDALSSQGDLIALPLDDLINGFLLDGVEGLDPVEATIVSTSFAGADGGEYQSSRREERDIILKITMEPNYEDGETIRQMRKRLYRVFMPKLPVSLRFRSTDEADWMINGRVKSFDNDQFSPDNTVSIVIRCFNPDFVDIEPVIYNGTTTSGDGEFLVDYQGTVETGVTFTLRPARTLSAFTIYQRTIEGSSSMDVTIPLVANDVLKISTTPGAKSALLTRSNVESSALYAVSPQSNWFELYPGDNFFRVYATGAGVPFEMQYFRRYGGM